MICQLFNDVQVSLIRASEFMKQKPIIGVTGPDKGGLAAWIMTWLALKRVGAKPVRICHRKPYDKTKLQGLVIGGGSDVEPVHYGQESLGELIELRSANGRFVNRLISLFLFIFRIVFSDRSSQGYDPDRDQLEKHLIQYALYTQLP